MLGSIVYLAFTSSSYQRHTQKPLALSPTQPPACSCQGFGLPPSVALHESLPLSPFKISFASFS